MAARIVYEGAAGGGGDLFEGLKIWLSVRVPLRAQFRQQVESNGGVVVQLEKNADIVIVDHARKECPPGSVSWKWLEQSIKNGRLENVEDHRAGPTHTQVREVGSTQPTKKTKTPFSPSDDRILMDWVIRAERKGLPILGNTLYQQLAEKHPHHTWQSWLDRWKKYVSRQNRPPLPEEEEEEDEDMQPIPVPPKAKRPRNQPPVSRPTPRSPSPPSISPPAISPPSRKRKLRTQAAVVSPVASERSHNSTLSLRANPFILKSPGGNIFTDEESELLFDAYDAIMDLRDDQAIDAWIAWSMENPNHTAQEWRNHFKEYVAPTTQARIESEKSANRAEEMPPPKMTRARKQVSNTSPAVPATCRPHEITDPQDSSGQTAQTPAKEDDTRDSYTSSQSDFERNLLILADSLDLEVDPNPVICGRIVPLFALWQVVQSDEFGGYDEVTGRKVWRRVALKLGFDSFQKMEAGRDLKICYSEILCDLESAERELRAGEDITSSQEAEMISDQLQQTAEQPQSLDGDGQYYSQGHEEEDELLDVTEEHEHVVREQEEDDDDLDCVQISPQLPHTPAGKRRLGNGRRNSDLSYHKRQRIDKGKGKERLEIPSTPEDVIHNTQTSRPAHQPSPLKFGHAELSSSSASSSVEEFDPIKLERQRLPAHQCLEPETQEFYHPVPKYPSLPKNNCDDEEEVEEGETSHSILGAPEEYIDQDDDADDLSVQQGPPPPPDPAPSHRNVSNSTPRGPAHSSSNNVSNATMRGTLHSSNQNYESSTQSQTESQTQAELMAFINKHVAEGHSQEIVIEALESTSMSIREALTVMDSLASGEGIPETMPGVWTADDDEALEAGKGTSDYQDVIRKHGISRIRARKKYLKDVREFEE